MRRVVMALMGLLVLGCSAVLGFRWFAGLGAAAEVARLDQRPFHQPDPAPWDAFLKEVVTDEGLVDYSRARGVVLARLHTYTASLARATPAAFGDDQARLALYLNAYNAFVIEGVLHYQPINSIEDVGPFHQFFRERRYRLAGQVLSLHDLETTLIRPMDARIHFALNCASRSCPPLRAEAFRGPRLEAQLSEATEAFVRNQHFNGYDARAGVWRLSALFDWYRDDFGGEAGVRAMLARFGPAGADAAAPIQFLDYDWRLNRAHGPGSASGD